MREAHIVTRPAFRAAGLPYLGRNEHGEIPALWDNDFLPRLNELAGIRTSGEAFGICRMPQNAAPGEFEYLAAVAVPPDADLPAGMVSWEIPAATYVVVRAHDVPEIAPVQEYIYREWLPASAAWEGVDGPMFELYPPDFGKTMDIDVYWPVRPKQGAKA
jgi:AraC family transcriptional regulator